MRVLIDLLNLLSKSSCNDVSLAAVLKSMMIIIMVDRPNTTPIYQDRKTLTFKALLYLNPYMYLFTCKPVCADCFVCCICHCLAWFRQDHGFDLPCGPLRPLHVFLKYSEYLKLLAQLVHMWECQTFCRFAQTSCGVYLCRWRIKNVWFLLAITATQWCYVLFDPYLFGARPR